MEDKINIIYRRTNLCIFFTTLVFVVFSLFLSLNMEISFQWFFTAYKGMENYRIFQHTSRDGKNWMRMTIIEVSNWIGHPNDVCVLRHKEGRKAKENMKSHNQISSRKKTNITQFSRLLLMINIFCQKHCPQKW